jgi:uncharacterized protein YbjQ (UPF0145 family)
MPLGEEREAKLVAGLQAGSVPDSTRDRLTSARAGHVPWIATLTPAELRIVRSHGIRPITSVFATCWLYYGASWTLAHAEGWSTALQRLRDEAVTAGANAVLDVKMRTVRFDAARTMDFTLVGTAVAIDGLPPNSTPIVATLPALEFIKLVESDVLPTGIAIGAHYEWLLDRRLGANLAIMGNAEAVPLSLLMENVRRKAHADLRNNAAGQGNGVLAHLNFGQLSADQNGFVARHIVVATTVDAGPAVPIVHDVNIVVDLHSGDTRLIGTTRHHQSYSTTDREGAI